MTELGTLLEPEKMYWRQRFKALWLREGDSNTRFFHAFTTYRKKLNNISFLFNDAGGRVDTPEGVQNITISCFGNSFNSSNVDSEAIIGAVQPNVNHDMSEFLTRPFTLEEFKKALFDMYSDKSPEPDGFNPTFYQKCWDVVGHDIFN
ncbi:hypothetical protein Scep_026569 [Stephania cephalantha]|uniref:CNGC5-like protein n=1 Tax=Stephania cephalantha TaxID=152367 RepID=A0AAP0HTF4_9MAGN